MRCLRRTIQKIVAIVENRKNHIAEQKLSVIHLKLPKAMPISAIKNQESSSIRSMSLFFYCDSSFYIKDTVSAKILIGFKAVTVDNFFFCLNFHKLIRIKDFFFFIPSKLLGI